MSSDNNMDTPPLDLADIRLTTAPTTWTPECPHPGDDVDEFPFLKVHPLLTSVVPTDNRVWGPSDTPTTRQSRLHRVDTCSDQLEGPAN